MEGNQGNKDNEISNMRMDLAEFVDWAKKSQESNERSLSFLNEHFNILLNLFISKNGAENLNLHHSAITSKCENIEVKKKKSSFESLPSTTHKVFNDFSDDEDLEDSLRIYPISLETISLNTEKPTDRIKRRKSLTYDDHKSEIYEKLIERTKNIINPELSLFGGSRRCVPPIFSGKKFEQNLRDLKRKCDVSYKKFPKALRLPDSYLEYGAARGWPMCKIRAKFYKKQKSVEQMQQGKLTLKKKTWLKKADLHIKHARASPILNLTPEQFEANLQTLREEYEPKKRQHVQPIPEFYFQYGAARGWNLTQVLKKHYKRSYFNRIKLTKKQIS